MNDKEKHVLLHALGQTGYRNHFVAGEGHSDHKTCLDLVKQGLMISSSISWIPDKVFHVTPKGQDAIGIKYKD
ncbi:MAG: hypothetical protein ACOC33_00575 [bacterium]